MTISVLDRNSTADQPSLGNLHDEAGKVDEATLPCRVNDPELWFAGPRALPRRRSRASRAVGCLGWTAVHPGRRRAPQASAWPPPQERGGRVGRRR
jgi:hypothetical protein